MSENVNIINQGFRYLLKALAGMNSGRDSRKKVIGLTLLILLILCVALR